jgi:hypothetical protein
MADLPALENRRGGCHHRYAAVSPCKVGSRGKAVLRTDSDERHRSVGETDTVGGSSAEVTQLSESQVWIVIDYGCVTEWMPQCDPRCRLRVPSVASEFETAKQLVALN